MPELEINAYLSTSKKGSSLGAFFFDLVFRYSDKYLNNLQCTYINVVKYFFICSLFVIVFTACFNNSNQHETTSENIKSIEIPTPTPTPTPTPINLDSILKETASVMSELQSFSFTLTHSKGTGTMLGDLLLITADGKVETYGSMDVEVQLLLGALPFQTRIISKDQTTYMQNPLSKEWEEMGQSLNPLAYFDPQTGIKSLLSGITNLSIGAKSSQSQYEIRGNIPTTLLESFVGSTIDDIVSLELSINKTSKLLNKVRIIGRLQLSDPYNIVRELALYDYDNLTNINLPE